MVSDWRKSIFWEEDGRLCVISFPPEENPCVAEVRLPLQLLAWLSEEIQTSSTGSDALNEIGGLLYGSISEQRRDPGKAAPPRRSVIVELFIALPISHPSGPFYHLPEEDKAAIRDQIASSADSTLNVVGMYRTHRRPDLHIDAEDEKVVNEFLTRPGSIFLLIKPEAAGAPQAAFFLRCPESISPEPVIKIPLDYIKLGASAANLTFQPEGIECPLAQTVPLVCIQPAPGSGKKIWAVGLALLAAATFVTLWVQQRRHSVVAAIPPSLSLRASVEQDHLRITWNQNAPQVTSAPSGLLVVNDGSSNAEIHLDSSVLETGTVEYFPRSPVVRLELRVGPSSDAVVIARPDSTSVAENNQKAPASSGLAERDRGRPPQPQRPEVSSAILPLRLHKPFVPPRRPAPSATAPQVPFLQATNLSISSSAGQFPLTSMANPVLPPPRSPAPATPESSPHAGPAPREQAIEYIGPQVRKRVLPEFSPSVDRLIVSKVTIRVRVMIDNQGRVVQAEPLTRGEPLVEYLSRLAVNAARGWRFEPARKANQNVESETVLDFDFDRNN